MYITKPLSNTIKTADTQRHNFILLLMKRCKKGSILIAIFNALCKKLHYFNRHSYLNTVKNLGKLRTIFQFNKGYDIQPLKKPLTILERGFFRKR